MTGITLKRPLRTEILFISIVVPSKSCLQIKRQDKRKVTLNPMILTEQRKTKKMEEKQSKYVEIFLFEFQISEKSSLD